MNFVFPPTQKVNTHTVAGDVLNNCFFNANLEGKHNQTRFSFR